MSSLTPCGVGPGGEAEPASEPGDTVSIKALSSLLVQVLEGSIRPFLPSINGKLNLYIRYLRRKPGRGLSIVYAADAAKVGHAGHGPDHDRWVTVTVDEAALAGTRIRFSAQQVREAQIESQAPGILTIANLGFAVQVFPADNGLPALAASLATAQDGPLFTPLEAAARIQLSDRGWHLRSAKAEPVRYKPSSRCVIRYTLHLDKESAGRVIPRDLSIFGKTYGDPEKARAVQANLQQLYGLQAQTHQPNIPRPLGTVEALGLTLTETVQSAEDADAQALRTGLQVLQPRVIKGPDGAVLDVVIPDVELTVTAYALARLHTSAVQPDGSPRSGAKEAKRASERAALIATYCPVLAQRARRLAEELAKCLQPLQPDNYRPAHGAFKSSQLLFCGKRVFVVDLDGFCLADPALDVGYFLAYLRPNGLWYQRPGTRRRFECGASTFVKAYGKALRERGFDSATVSGILQRSRLYEAATLFKIATRRVNRLNSPRSGELAAMLTEIEACIADGQ